MMSRRLLWVLLLGWGFSGFAQQNSETSKEKEDNEALLQRIEESDFESLFDISIEHNVDWEVGTPTKVAKRSSRSPATVTVISHEHIKMFGYDSVAEVLNHVSGFSSTDDLVQSNFGIRGIHPGARAGNRSFKVMLDGQPISFRANSNNFIGRNLVPIALVERIEIVKGPVSALYGANAFLGVVNIVTKSSEEFIRKGERLNLQLQQGSNELNGIHLQYSGGDTIAGWDTTYGLSYGRTETQGLALPRTSPDYDHFNNTANNNTANNHNASLQSESKPMSFYLRSRYISEAKNHWQFGVHYQQLNADNPFADLNPLRDSGYSTVGLYNSFVRLAHMRHIAENMTANFHLSFKQGGPLSDDRVELGSNQFYYERDIGYQSYDFSAELNWLMRDVDHWLFGVDYASDEHDLETFSRVEKTDGSKTPLSDPVSKTLNSHALYLQWLSKWAFDIETIVGLRFDHNDIYNNKTSYRLGAVYPLTEKHSVKLLLGSSYQAPSMELLYRQPIQRGDVIGNPNLKPQEAETVELVFNGSLGQNMRYTASFYRSQVEDLVVYRDDHNNLTAINAANADSEGVELDIGFDSDNLSAYFNVGWHNIDMQASSLFVLENRANGELFPKYTVSTGVSYQWGNGIRASFDNRFNGRRPASTSNVLSAETYYQIDAFLDSTVTLQYQFKWFEHHPTELIFKVQDLWDNQFVNPGFGGIDIPSLGRRYTFSIAQRF